MFLFNNYRIDKYDERNFRCYLLKNEQVIDVTYHSTFLNALLNLRDRLQNKTLTPQIKDIDTYVDKLQNLNKELQVCVLEAITAGLKV